MKVLELKGYKSLRALNAFSALMLGLKMLPDYLSVSYEDFFEQLQKLPEKDQKKLIKKAALFVELQKAELEALVCFCTDRNGVPYTSENLAGLKPDELIEIIVAVAFEISKIKIDFVTDDEKKN